MYAKVYWQAILGKLSLLQEDIDIWVMNLASSVFLFSFPCGKNVSNPIC